LQSINGVKKYLSLSYPLESGGEILQIHYFKRYN
jgi:hypothetical protein